MRITKEEFREFAQALWAVLKKEPVSAAEVPAAMRGAVQSLRLFLGFDRLNPLVTDTEAIAEKLASSRSRVVMTGQSGWQRDPSTGKMVFDQIHASAGRLAAENLRNFATVWGTSNLEVIEDSKPE